MTTDNFNLDLSDPAAEQPSITMLDGRTLTVLTFGTMPHIHGQQVRRLVQRISVLGTKLNDMIEEAIPVDADEEMGELGDGLDKVQGQIDSLNERTTRLICPALTDEDMSGLSQEVHSRLHARFLYSMTLYMAQITQDIQPEATTSE